MSPLNVHARGLRQRPSDQPSRAICDPSTPSRLGRGRPPPAAPLTSPPRATRSFAVIWLSSERSGRLYAYHSAALACAWRACSRINQSSRPTLYRILFLILMFVRGKCAEPKMAFNFAHLLSAACGGAPRRSGRLRRPLARCARFFSCWGSTEKLRHSFI